LFVVRVAYNCGNVWALPTTEGLSDDVEYCAVSATAELLDVIKV